MSLPPRWELASLGEVADILDSRRVPINSDEREMRKGPIPYYGATGQVGWIDDFLFDEELVLLGEDGAPFLDATKPKAYLKRYRASVLQAACEGRLVPTEAELARKEGRDYEPASELLKRILAERRTKWKADQARKVIAAGKPPRDDGWKTKYKEPVALV